MTFFIENNGLLFYMYINSEFKKYIQEEYVDHEVKIIINVCLMYNHISFQD